LGGGDLIQFLIYYGNVFKLAENQLYGFHNNSSDVTQTAKVRADFELCIINRKGQ